MSASLNNPTQAPVPISSALAPKEGPRALPLALLFGNASAYSFDIALLQQQGWQSNVQAAYVDNSLNAAALTITIPNVCSVSVPANTQGTIPLPCPQNANLIFACSGGQTATIVLFNVPMPAQLWNVNNSSGLPVSNGKVQVQDATVDSAVVSGYMQSQIAGVTLGSIVTPLIADANGYLEIAAGVAILAGPSSTPASPTSAQLFAAAPGRRYLCIKAPETADLWFHPNGGAASIGGAGCLKVPQGTTYESGQFCSTAQINYYCATGSLTFASYQA